MEDSHYFLKSIGLDYEKNFCESLARDEMDNLDYLQLSYGNNESDSKEGNRVKEPDTDKDDICDKQEQTINDEVSQIMSKVEADDFFSSLELQSSSKTSSGVLGLSFQNKPMSGIVTRSRSLLSTSHDTSKLAEMKTMLKMKVKKRTKVDKGYVKRRKKNDKARRDVRKTAGKSTGKKVRMSSGSSETPRQQQHLDKLDENALSNKCKDDDDWLFFQQLETKKEMGEDKLFENKQLLGNDLNHVTRQGTSELFSMSPISIGDVMSEDKDEVDKLLEGEYDETFLEEMDEFSHAPPRSHTGGKWKPGSLPVRSSPMLWQSQNWENFLEDRGHEEGSKARSDTPIESPTDLRAFAGGKWKSIAPPATHTGGKWKPITPPATHTGGKWKPLTPPASHTGGKWKPVTPPATYSAGKWKPPDVNQKLKKSESKMASDDDGEGMASQTGGKWKPSSSLSLSKSHCRDIASTSVQKLDKISTENTHGKWSSGFVNTSFTRSTLDIVASCQSTSGKCLKTSGGVIQYFCSPCNRRLSSKKMYKKHIQSELHLKRVLQENDLEFDSRSLKMYRGFMAQSTRNERASGKRVIKKPEMYNETPMTRTHKEKSEIKGKCKKFSRKEVIRCEVCKIKIPSYQLGKHLVSYYHTRRSQVQDPNQRTLILNNIHAIVKQAPYQCGICKFYCNSHVAFKRHWTLPVHVEVEKSYTDRRFWCALCNFETATARSMELHLDSNSHREVIQAVNKSIPIIIRHKKIFRCEICFKEYRFNREILHHKQTYHPDTVMDSGDKFTCKLCDRRCKTMKSLQKHIIQFHKDETSVPYFCSTCSEFFSSMEEAKEHRNGQVHKFKRKLSEKGISLEKGLSWSCSYCRESFDDLAKLKVHLFEKHRSLLPKCMKCGKVFALSQEVSRHVKKNECVFTSPPESAGFKCEICPFATDVQSEFLVHAAIHQKKDNADRKIDCPLCGSSFTQAALSIHLRTHLNEKTYRCSMCSSTFVRKYRYVAHLKSKHFSKEEESKTLAEITEDNAKTQTPEVGEREKTVDERRQAEGKKTDDDKKVLQKEMSLPKRQTCGDSKCKYVAKDEKDLENHSLIHVGPKLYKCPECPYYAKTNTVIKRHFMIHMGEKQFSCPHCSFKGRLKSHLKRHLRLHTGAKPYKCPHCPYMCNILENLRKHVLHTKIHPGKKLYECKMCKFDTNGSKEFKVHLMESHQKDCRVADAIVASGVYNREDDVASSNNPTADSSKSASRSAEPKPLSRQMKKKIETLTQKFAPIAPKPEPPGKSEDPCLKNTKNLVEDKRKVLEMELEKLKQQIKPDVKKAPRFYPSPAEKGFKLKRATEEEPEKEAEIGKKPRPEVEEMELAQDVGDMMLVLPSITSSADEIPAAKFLPSTYILCDNEIEQEETEFYLLENYDV